MVAVALGSQLIPHQQQSVLGFVTEMGTIRI